MTSRWSRRSFLTQASALIAARHIAHAEEAAAVVAETSYGKIRGALVEDIKIFKGIPYGQSTAGANRFMPPRKPAKWSGMRDAIAYGPSAPQTVAPPGSGAGVQATLSPGATVTGDEDCLVLNVFTPSVSSGKRPVMVWLHGGGFASGSGSGRITDGTSLAHTSNVVVVTLNHRLNVLGSTYLGEAAGPDFAFSGSVGMLDIVAALEWVRDNIAQFGGDPNLVTIFGQSGGGRKVATLMSMPSAKGLFHRGIIESGALLRLTTQEDAIRTTELLLAELGLKANQARELQSLPIARLLAANTAVQRKLTLREPGMTPNSPMVDGKALPGHPWDPTGPSISAGIPLLIGWARTEETLYDPPSPEKLALDEAGLLQRVSQRIGGDPNSVVQAFRRDHPAATPWDLWILIATDHPRGAHARELAKRKAAQGGSPAYVYRFDWETPEGGGHMRSPHGVEVPFVFNNIKIAGPLISKTPEAYALAEKVSASWVAFASTGNPNVAKLPKWPAYSAKARETMLFNNDSRVGTDPAPGARVAMEKALKLA